jgi:hypothetical protein
MATCPAGWVLRSAPRAFCVSQPLWATCCASVARLQAAFRSRSSWRPQTSQAKVRSARVSLASGQVELLDHHGAVLGGQCGGELVEGVTAQVGRPGVDPRQPVTGLVAAPGASCAAMQLSVQPPQLALGVLEGMGIGNRCSGGQHRQMPDANIHPHHARPAVASSRGRPLYLDGEGDVPAVGGAGDGGGEDAGGAMLEAAGELAGGLVGPEHANAGQLDAFPGLPGAVRVGA